MGEPLAKALAKAEADGIALPNTVEHLKEQVRTSTLELEQSTTLSGQRLTDADSSSYSSFCVTPAGLCLPPENRPGAQGGEAVAVDAPGTCQRRVPPQHFPHHAPLI